MKKVLLLALILSLSTLAFAQDDSSRKPLEDLNTKVRLDGYFCAASSIKDPTAFGGFGTSSNFSKLIEPGAIFPPAAVSLIADPEQETVFRGKYKGLKVVLVNTTDQEVPFFAQDSRLSIVQEALDADGQWKPLENLPSSWCGNSYHHVILGPRRYWEFAAPRYTGDFQTRFRFRLTNEKSTIYSNEFEGSMNREQFRNTEPEKF